MNTTINKVLVSVIAVCYNHTKFVKQTLDSIISQTHKNIQLIIIDDCSIDNSVETINTWIKTNKCNVEFIKNQQNIGLCATLNKALSYVKADYLQIIACDDILVSDKLEKQLSYLLNNPDISIVCSNFVTIDENGNELSVAHKTPNYIPDNLFEKIITYEYIVHSPTVLLHTKVYDVVGLYPTDIIQEDYYMWLRLSKEFKFGYIYDSTVKYRILQNSLSKNPETIFRLREDALKVVKRLYDQNNFDIDLCIKSQSKIFEDIYNAVFYKRRDITYLFEIINEYSVLDIYEHISKSNICLKIVTKSLFENFKNTTLLLRKYKLLNIRFMQAVFTIRNLKRTFFN